MEIKGKITSLLIILSLSFSIHASNVICPSIEYLNQHPEFNHNNDNAVVTEKGSEIGAVIVRFQKNSQGSPYKKWVHTSIFQGAILCIYEAGPEIEIVLKSKSSGGWKPRINNRSWNGTQCVDFVREHCSMTDV